MTDEEKRERHLAREREYDRKRYQRERAKRIAKSSARFATDATYRAKLAEYKRAKRRAITEARARSVTCAHCGAVFITGDGKRRYCNPACATNGAKARRANGS